MGYRSIREAGPAVRVAHELLVAVIIADLTLLIGVHALGSGLPYDFGIYYRGGEAAWASGNPYLVSGWVGTPFLAAVLGPVTAMFGVMRATLMLTVVNLAIVAAAGVWLWRVLTPRMSTMGALVVTAGCTILFAPVVSTLWWRQLNLIVLALAFVGFAGVRRGRVAGGAALLGLSVALKPLLVLVPLALLLRRETRRAGAISLAWIVGLTAGGQLFLAARARDAGLLNPLSASRAFTDRVAQPGGSHVCHPGNIALQGASCRVFGTGSWTAQRVLVLVAALAVAGVALWAVRRYRATSFEYLAIACAVSLLFGPIEWTHYQVVLVPLLAVLVVHLLAHPRPAAWAVLVVAYLGLSLVWSPSMLVPTQVSHWFGGTPIHASFVLMRITMFFQLLLIALAVVVLRSDTPVDADEAGHTVAMDEMEVVW